MIDNVTRGPVRTINQPGKPDAHPTVSSGWQSVDSSHLMNVRFDQPDQLYIQFRDGSVYVYSGVPADVYDGLLSAGSKGKFFNTMIEGQYRYRRQA